MTHHVIYVPGIGDSRALGQDIGIAWWRLLGVRPHYHPVGWADGEQFEPKLAKLLQEIDSYLQQGDAVSLLGFSAGASAVLNAFAERRHQLTAVICVSGKINHPDGARNYFGRQPAFGEALYRLQPLLATLTDQDKRHLLTVYPTVDTVVPHQDAIITGVVEKRIRARSHPMAIAAALTIYAPIIVRFCKQRKKDLQITNNDI